MAAEPVSHRFADELEKGDLNERECEVSSPTGTFSTFVGSASSPSPSPTANGECIFT